MCYTADGKCILAGGNAKNVCIYSVPDQILVKKFEITCNMSFDGTLVRQGCHGTGKTGNLKVHSSRQGKHREFAKKY